MRNTRAVRVLMREIIIVSFALLFLLLIVHRVDCYGQVVKGWEVIPPSPDAAALGKYGSTPVGLYTGIPEISIPIFNIQTRQLELPISMSYHAGGFRVAEAAPWTGLGWSLHAGGAVSRSVRGIADELYQGEYISAAQIDENDYEQLMLITAGVIDNESDLYFYSLPGRSGKYVLDNSRVPYLIPEAPLRITHSQAAITITTENGTLYTFAAREKITAGAYRPTGEESQTYTGTYYLTRILSADKTDSILFSYSYDRHYNEISNNYTEVVGDKCTANGILATQHDRSYSTTFRNIDVLRLAQITFAQGRIQFVGLADRTDTHNSRLSEIRIENRERDGSYQLAKTFKFETGYFSTGTAKRLKLNAIVEYDANGDSIRRHDFYYNESRLLPHRLSFGVDWWGFYNGKNLSALSPVPKKNVNVNGFVYEVGEADRSPDSTAMKACILKKIQYPTGGWTEYKFEPHFYDGVSYVERDASASAGEMNNTTELLEHSIEFTPNSSGYAELKTHCSNVDDPDPYFSRVILRRLDGTQTLVNHIYDPYNYPAFEAELLKSYTVFLNAGVTYELRVMAKGESLSSYYNGAAFSKATISWQDFAPPGTPVMAGGLRIKEIRDYASLGAEPQIRVFKYGEEESGKGVLITPENKLSTYEEEKLVRFWEQGPIWCTALCNTTRRFVYGNVIQDLTAFNGATVVYPEVAVYHVSNSGANWKSIHKFEVVTDEIYPAAQSYRDGVILLDNSWKAGEELWRAEFVAESTDTVRKVENNYLVLQPTTFFATKIGRIGVDQGVCGPMFSSLDTYSRFYFFDYPVRSGVRKLRSTKETTYSSLDHSQVTEKSVENFYNNLDRNHQQLSRQTLSDSESLIEERSFWYPADYGNIDNITSVLSKNILNVPIKEETYRNGKIISGKVNRLNEDGKIVEVYHYQNEVLKSPLQHDPNVLIPTDYNKKVQVRYDPVKKYIESVQAVNNVEQAYLWGYGDCYPIAMIVNADVSMVAVASFESNESGNWNYAGTVDNGMEAKTGDYYYLLTNQYPLTLDLLPGVFILEYWAKSNVTVSGSATVSDIHTSEPDPNGWILNKKLISTEFGGTLSLSGYSVPIDELRIYPADAQVTTYTYDMINGMTSMTDPNNLTTYYEYDSFGRLKHIKDSDGNILKRYEYNYRVR